MYYLAVVEMKRKKREEEVNRCKRERERKKKEREGVIGVSPKAGTTGVDISIE